MVSASGPRPKSIPRGGSRSSLPRLIPIAAALALGLPLEARSLTIRVPQDAPDLQAGLAAAAPGDTVLAASGTYTGPGNRDLDFVGKDLVLRSEVGPQVTIIDVDAAFPDRHRGFVFTHGESPAARVEGFTITRGDEDGGGALCTNSSSPTFADCQFTRCDGTNGGGVNADGASPTFVDCTFAQNTPGLGGGVFLVDSRSTFLRCTFADNGTDSGGGGWVSGQSAVEFIECEFMRNLAIDLSNVWGGGLSASSGATITLDNCIFTANDAHSAEQDGEGWGGAVYGQEATLIARSCTFQGNQADRGGAIYVDGGAATIEDCVFRGNTAEDGGAIACLSAAVPVLSGCTLHANGASGAGSGVHVGSGSGVTVTNTILAFGAGGEAVSCLGGGALLRCSDVYGNAGGDWVGCIAGQLGADGNISTDPLFCRPDIGDLTIAFDSPCAPGPTCGLIGALAPACEAAVEPTTWGAIKAGYRVQQAFRQRPSQQQPSRR